MTKQRLTITVEGDLSPERVDEALRSVAEIYERPVSTRGGWGHIPGVGYKWTVEPVEPVERTPEVVLRAMLRAYEASALEARMAWLTLPDGAAKSDAKDTMKRVEVRAVDVRAVTARLIAMPDSEHLIEHPTVRTDYEARLRGERPLDAPPMEVP